MERIQYAPRRGATYEASLDILVPALARLRECQTSIDALVLIDSLPDMILPGLAYVASRRQYVPRDAVQAVVTYCGPLFLERCLGRRRSRELLKRCPKRAACSGLVRYDA
ncbi:hypothetical protein ACM42_23605 [Bradyrhizobium sp. CCBAU 25338]|nr:hypothetical protein [Bradyrhizobium sp. CCBAU 45389]MDA9531380.1 hypothetical protein [Bradyrhizobium sp. CCBAU 25338]RXH32320.1 hypothetical protein XH84_14045 [Bradyrhizobium nanningense]